MTWTVGTPDITTEPDGGFVLSLPLLLDGTQVADVQGSMTGGGALTIMLITLPGAVPLSSFQAFQQGV